MKRNIEVVVACVIALIVFTIFAHPATLVPNGPLDQRLSGTLLPLLFCAVLSALTLMQRPDDVVFGLFSSSDSCVAESVSERLALIGFHRC